MRGVELRLHLLANELDVPLIKASTKCPRGVAKSGGRAGVRAPEVVAVESGFESGLDSRQGVMDLLKRSRKDVAALRRELQLEERGTDVHEEVSRAVADAEGMKDVLQTRLDSAFIPQHSPTQLVSPRDVLASSLFGVRARGAPRHESLVLTLASTRMGELKYRGPELRQVDGLVFMLLVNMLRDIKAGVQAAFAPADVCELLLGGYSGQSREQLRQVILRLQQGVLEFPRFAVQLAQRFEFPDDGPWRVALDPDIVELFSWSRQTWLELETSLSLPVGLATWLYGYVESQSTLIPVRVDAIRALCGSDATATAFDRQLRRALHQLVAADVLDPGWSVAQGTVRWMKARDLTIPNGFSGTESAQKSCVDKTP